MLSSFIYSLISIYLLVCLLLFLMQDKMIFIPPAPYQAGYENWQAYEYQLPINGKTLHGWHLSQSPNKSKTALIYFGGNAEDVFFNLMDADHYNTQQLFFTNYPGYGKSQGKPSQKTLYADALATYDSLVNQYQLEPDAIIIMGRSLGSSVAAYVASQRPNRGLIMTTPFDSMENVAAALYKIFPVRWLLKHEFNTSEHLKQVTSPILVMAAERDEVIPVTNLQKLVQDHQDKIQLVNVKGVGHNNITSNLAYFQEINRFISAISPR